MKKTYSEQKAFIKKQVLNLDKLATLLKEKLISENLSFREAEIKTGVNHMTISNTVKQKSAPSLLNGLILCEFIGLNPMQLIDNKFEII